MRKKRIVALSYMTILLWMSFFIHNPFGVGSAQAASPHNCGAWNVVSSPHTGQDSDLNKVAVVSANDVWAVGSYSNNQFFARTLTEHWNGTTWSIITSPNITPYGNYLRGVVAISSNNVWAVGDYQRVTAVEKTLVEHWDGTSWSIVPSPSAGSKGSFLLSVTDVSANDIWAVGYYQNKQGNYLPLTEHWNGTNWSIVTIPNPGSGFNILYDVAAISTNDVWTVGDASSSSDQTLVEHWNGTSWNIVPSPNPSKSIGAGLFGVAAASAKNIWAVGYNFNSGSMGKTPIEHWNGMRWSIVPSPSPATFSYLRGIAAIPGTSQVWTVGYTSNGSNGHTLTEFYC